MFLGTAHNPMPFGMPRKQLEDDAPGGGAGSGEMSERVARVLGAESAGGRIG